MYGFTEQKRLRMSSGGLSSETNKRKKRGLQGKRWRQLLLAAVPILSVGLLLNVLSVGGTTIMSAHPRIQETAEPSIHPDGWDLNFGENGRLETGCYRENNAGETRATTLHTQPDGKIILSAYCDDEWSILRFTQRGALDTSFGIDGRLVTNFQVAAIQPDGKLITRNSNKLQRYEKDGRSDPLFGVSGLAKQLSELGYEGRYVRTAVAGDGSIIAVGIGAGKPLIAKFTADGALDTSFNGNGYHVTEPEPLPASHDGANCSNIWNELLMQPDGKFIVSRCQYRIVDEFTGEYHRDWLLVRFNADGTIDEGFGDMGTVTFQRSIVKHLFQKSANTIGLFVSNRFYELNNDGTVVSNYLSTTPGTFQDIYQIGADSQGRLLFIINSIPTTISRWFIDGTLDASFGTDGFVQQPAFASFTTNFWLESDTSLLLTVNIARTVGQSDAQDNQRFEVAIVRRVEQVQPTPTLTLTITPTTTVTPTIDGTSTVTTPVATAPPNEGTPIATAIPVSTPSQTPVSTQSPTTTLPPTDPPEPTTPKPLALIYAVLDNNLGTGSGWSRLVNNIEAGATDQINVRLFIDGPSLGDVYIYDIMPDNNPFCPSQFNPTCNGRYVQGDNFWTFPSEDSANPASLYQFLVDAAGVYPNPSMTALTLIGHGSGWSANVLPGQPSFWSGQSDTAGGMLWDDRPSADRASSQSLSIQALRHALYWAENTTGNAIDLLYLDGCAMGMIEVAYEIRDSADYLLASANIDWASFNYDALLPTLSDAESPAQLGQRWLNLEASKLRENPGHPFTLTLTDLSNVDTIADNASALAAELQASLASNRTLIEAAFAASERFDSNFDGAIDVADSYTDLSTFADSLSQRFPSESRVTAAAQTLQSAISQAVVATDYENGAPWLYPNRLWRWQSIAGLGVYLPLEVDEQRRSLFYVESSLGWAERTRWDEFLRAFWTTSSAVRSAQFAMPICEQTTDNCTGLANPLPQNGNKHVTHLPAVFSTEGNRQ